MNLQHGRHVFRGLLAGGFENQNEDFKVNTLFDGKPMQVDEVGGDGIIFSLPGNKASRGALNVLKTPKQSARYTN